MKKHIRKPSATYDPTPIPITIKKSEKIKKGVRKYLETIIKPGVREHIKDAIEWICFEADAERQAVQRAIEVHTGAHPKCKYMRFTEFDDDTENVFIQLKPEHQRETQ